MKDDKFLSMIDNDVELIYRRKAKTSSTDEINGFNPIILIGAFSVIIIALVVISQNEKSTPVQQQSPVIINNN